MKDSMEQQFPNFPFRRAPRAKGLCPRDLRSNYYFAQKVHALLRLTPIAKAQDIGGIIPVTVRVIERAHFPRADEYDLQGTCGHAHSRENLLAVGFDRAQKYPIPPLPV